MSNSGKSGNNSNNQPSIKITLPNPNAHHYAKPPASPPRSTSSGGSYPFPGAYPSQSKSHHAKFSSPLPSPSHLLGRDQDNYLNSPPSSILNAYSYSNPAELPDSSSRHSSRENHYSVPSLNMPNIDSLPGRTTPPPSSRPSSIYSNPIPFVNSGPSSYASHPNRPSNQSPTHYSSNSASFSPPMPRHSKHAAPLPSPPDSPSHEPFPQHPNVYPRYPSNFPQPPQKYSNTYLDSPSHSGPSNSSPKIPHSSSPTVAPSSFQHVLNTPQSPKVTPAAQPPMHHSSVQSQEYDEDEYEEVHAGMILSYIKKILILIF